MNGLALSGMSHVPVIVSVVPSAERVPRATLGAVARGTASTHRGGVRRRTGGRSGGREVGRRGPIRVESPVRSPPVVVSVGVRSHG